MDVIKSVVLIAVQSLWHDKVFSLLLFWTADASLESGREYCGDCICAQNILENVGFFLVLGFFVRLRVAISWLCDLKCVINNRHIQKFLLWG